MISFGKKQENMMYYQQKNYSTEIPRKDRDDGIIRHRLWRSYSKYILTDLDEKNEDNEEEL